MSIDDLNSIFIRGISNPSRRIKNARAIPETFFPLRVKYIMSNTEEICNTPKDIKSSRSFVVLQCNVIL